LNTVAAETLKQADAATKAAYLKTQKDGVIEFPTQKRKADKC
jgi:hypothetical protein